MGALLPTVGAALVISGDNAWLNRKILSHPIAVFIGLVSYPLYLWHWPLLSYASIVNSYFEPELPRLVRFGSIFVAFVLAVLTYRWIERPMRSGQGAPLRIAGLCLAMTVMAGVGLAVVGWDGHPSRLPAEIRDIAKINVDTTKEWRAHSCFLEPQSSVSKFVPECVERERRPLLMLWGDSHAAAVYPGLRQLQGSLEFALAQYATAGCPPLLSFSVSGHAHCVANNDFVFSVLQETQPDIVLLYSSWTYGDVRPKLREFVEKLRAINISRIVVMGPPPAWMHGLPKAVHDYYWLHHEVLPKRSSFRVYVHVGEQTRQLQEYVLSLGVEYISIWDAICAGNECLTRVGDELLSLFAFDGAHLTIPGSAYLARAIAPCLFPVLSHGNDSRRAGWLPSGVDQSRICSRRMGPSS